MLEKRRNNGMGDREWSTVNKTLRYLITRKRDEAPKQGCELYKPLEEGSSAYHMSALAGHNQLPR
jgi:hypothetical protein